MWYLDDRHIDLIRRWKPYYIHAAATVGGLTWQCLVPVHYREHGLENGSDVPGEGPFGCDQGGEGGADNLAGIHAFVRKVCEIYSLTFGSIEHDISLAAVVAAYELKQKARANIVGADGLINEGALADAYWGYNGRSPYHTVTGEREGDNNPKSFRWSPYVSNDPQNGVSLRLTGTVPVPVSAEHPDGRKHINTVDVRAGCIPLYHEVMFRIAEIG